MLHKIIWRWKYYIKEQLFLRLYGKWLHLPETKWTNIFIFISVIEWETCLSLHNTNFYLQCHQKWPHYTILYHSHPGSYLSGVKGFFKHYVLVSIEPVSQVVSINVDVKICFIHEGCFYGRFFCCMSAFLIATLV